MSRRRRGETLPGESQPETPTPWLGTTSQGSCPLFLACGSVESQAMRMGTRTLTWHFSLPIESSWAIQRGQRNVEGEEEVTRPRLSRLYVSSSFSFASHR